MTSLASETCERLVVGVTFPAEGRAGHYAVPGPLPGLVPGAWVLVESGRGQRAGQASTPVRPAAHDDGGRIRRVLRLLDAAELLRLRAAEEREPAAFRAALAALRARRIPARLVAVQIDGFTDAVTACVATSDRLDSAEVGRALSDALGARVAVRQLSARQEAAEHGGLGRCGRELCCATFLDETPKTTARMAKDQGLGLAEDRATGVCGKTLCCLAYEQDFYREQRAFLPKVGKRARTTDGAEGKVVAVDAMRLVFTLLLADGRRSVVPATAWERNAQRDVPDAAAGASDTEDDDDLGVSAGG